MIKWAISLISMISALAWPGWAGVEIPAKDSVSLASVKALISQYQITSVAELLPKLPKSFRSKYVLMHQSESLQQGSLLAPRVILFSLDGKFVLTFNGDASQYGFETVETMSFVSEGPMKDKFIFEEIVFSADLEARTQYLKSQNAFDEAKKLVRDHQNPNRIGPNPAVCLGCHKKDPRPNWNQGDQWPGAYGKIQDTIWNQRMPVRDPVSGEVVQSEDFLENRSFPLFLKLAPKHPRYKHVVLNFIDSTQFPRTNNFEFSAAMGKLNARRIVRILSQSKFYPRFKVQLLSQLLDCSEINPSSIKYSSLQKLLAAYKIEIWDLYTHFQQGVGNTLVSPRAGSQLIPKYLMERDSSLREIGERCAQAQ